MSTQINRRDFLGKSLLATALAGASARSLEEATFLAAVDGGKAATDGKPSPDSDEAVPRGKLGKLEVSRLIMGGNLIGGWAHSRDLIYASSLFKAYNTQEKIFETMALAEAHGVNTILLNPAYLSTAREYNQKHGGKLQVISEIHPPIEGAVTDQQLWDEARRLIDAGADTIYIQGNVGDQLVRAGRLDVIAKTVEAVKSEGLCAGVGGHTLAVPMACEEKGIPVDYYVKTYHRAIYASASRAENRKEWFEQGYYDNVWCTDADKTQAFMKGVKKPWFAFKVLAAGAIHPQDGFLQAFEAGADFVVVGMFDFQIKEDALIVSKVLRSKSVAERERAWFA
jgi:hypothetical protein